MRIAFVISILLLAFIGAKAQDYYLSPAYYPTDHEISLKWEPVKSWGMYSNNPELEYGSALPTWWEKNRKSFAITGIQLASIILDATGDAVYDMGKEAHNNSQMFWGHTLQASAIGAGMLLIPMIDWERPVGDGIRLAISYVAMRYALFDMTYNITRGLDPLYADGIKSEMAPGGRAFTQTIFLGLSISINFTEF